MAELTKAEGEELFAELAGKLEGGDRERMRVEQNEFLQVIKVTDCGMAEVCGTVASLRSQLEEKERELTQAREENEQMQAVVEAAEAVTAISYSHIAYDQNWAKMGVLRQALFSYRESRAKEDKP